MRTPKYGNGMVVYIICWQRRLRERSSPNWFILSLAIADLFVGATNLSTIIACSQPNICSPRQATSKVLLFMKESSFAASATSLCILTFDRYLAVVHPFSYRQFMTCTKCLYLIAGAWCLGVAVVLPGLLYKLGVLNGGKSSYEFCFMILFLLMILFMIYAYVRIATVVRRHRKVIIVQERQMASNTEHEITRPSERKSNQNTKNTSRQASLASVAIVVGIFLACNAIDMSYFLCKAIDSCKASQDFLKITDVTRYVNSAANVFAYALVKGEFREHFRNMLLCKKELTPLARK